MKKRLEADASGLFLLPINAVRVGNGIYFLVAHSSGPSSSAVGPWRFLTAHLEEKGERRDGEPVPYGNWGEEDGGSAWRDSTR